jgi:hypothetical protein
VVEVSEELGFIAQSGSSHRDQLANRPKVADPFANGQPMIFVLGTFGLKG